MVPYILETCVALEESMLAIFRSVPHFKIDHPSVRNFFEKSLIYATFCTLSTRGG